MLESSMVPLAGVGLLLISETEIVCLCLATYQACSDDGAQPASSRNRWLSSDR
jgi:hypothetical protein